MQRICRAGLIGGLQNVQKEDFMRGVKDFLRESLPAMHDYILVVSTPIGDGGYGSFPGTMSDRHDRLNVVNYLRQRSSTISVLAREAIPILPHLLDIPRHLAIITSAVIRTSRDFQARAKSHDPGDRALNNFCSRCFEVEEHALLRVSQLAAKLSSERQQPSISTTWTKISSSATAATTNPPLTSQHASSQSSPPASRRPRKLGRPSTAPSSSETDTSRRRADEPTAPSPLVRPSTHMALDTSGPSSRNEQRRWSQQKGRLAHFKSTSTDSVPSLGLHDAFSPPIRPIRTIDALTDVSDDAGKRKKGLLRILRR